MAEQEVTTQGPEQPDTVQTAAPAQPEPQAALGISPRRDTEQCRCGRLDGVCVCGAAAEDSPTKTSPTYSPVYAIGRVEPRFPSVAVEKEFAQARGRAETAGLSDREALRAVLSERDNRYLARRLCYVLTIEGLESYLLQPRDPADFEVLVESIRSTPSPMDVDVVIGMRGPLAPPELCNGLTLPLVAFDQIYSFDRDFLIKSIPRPKGTTAKKFDPAAQDLFDRITQMVDNSGATDEHRAVNYLAVRYPEIYAKTADQFSEDASLTAVAVHPSPLSFTRKIVEVIFSYTHRRTDVTEKFFVRVDVSEEFPFLVTKLSPYYDR